MKEKSYELTPEQEAEVAEVIAAGRLKYESIAHIVLENTTFDAGVFFEHELEEDDD